VAGTGAKYARLADGKPKNMSGRLVYAMKITDKLSMPDYDRLTTSSLPNKIPDLNSRDEHRKLGDSSVLRAVLKPTRTTRRTSAQVAHDRRTVR
jgi:Nucleotide modification associated domain 2